MGERNTEELARAYELLRETNDRLYSTMKAFQIAAEESGSLVFTYDTKKQTILADPRTAAAFGVSTIQNGVPYEMVKLGIVTEDTTAEYIRIHEAMIQGEQEAGGIVKLVQVDGTQAVYELKFRAILTEEGKPSGTAVGIYRDITRDYLKNKEQECRLERILQSMRDEYIGIMLVDLEEDTYELLSYESVGSFWLPLKGCYNWVLAYVADALVAEEYREEFLRFGSISYLREVLSGESRVEMEFMTSDETASWQRSVFKGAEYRTEEGKWVPVKAVLYMMDIDQQKTERLRQQQAITEAYRYAEAASEAKSSFLSRMSHDIRTPMNAIIGMTAIAGTHLDNPQRVGECLGKITSASRHLLSLINEVLDMSKIESGAIQLQSEAFHLGELVDNTVTMILPQIQERQHQFRVNLENLKHEYVIGDSLRLQQVFVNLMSNAVKYTPDGGEITFSIRERRAGGGFGLYEFVFEDNGIGMSEEFQKVLFEPFTRAEEGTAGAAAGTGLGMAITRNLIRMMDGDIQVVSSLGDGSRFTVTLQLKLQEDRADFLTELKDLPVLVVDDEAGVCESTCIILDYIGMKGEWCQTGEEAVERTLRRHRQGEDYFAVILDWKMPGMDGVATAREIRRRAGADIPILFLTAYDWSEIEQEAREAGVDHFLTKPLFKSRLISHFKGILKKEERQEPELGLEGLRLQDRQVLLAEDNELNAEIASELISITGASVLWAKNGREAVRMVEEAGEGQIQLVLMDIQMPCMNGYEAAAAIRQLNREDVKSLPIVAMTANAFTEDVNRAAAAGMDGHISKPIDIRQLAQTLKRYLTKI